MYFIKNLNYSLKYFWLRLFHLSLILFIIQTTALAQTSPGLTTHQAMFAKEVDGMDITFMAYFRLEKGQGGLGGISLLVSCDPIIGQVLADYVKLDGKTYYPTSFDGSTSKIESTEYRELWSNVKLVHMSVTYEFSGVKENVFNKPVVKPGNKESFPVTALSNDKNLIGLDEAEINSVYLEGTSALKSKIRSIEASIAANEEKKKKEKEDAEKKADDLKNKLADDINGKDAKQKKSVDLNSSENTKSQTSQVNKNEISNTNYYTPQSAEDIQKQQKIENANQAKSLNQQAQDLAMQGDIEGAQDLANQANNLDPSVANASATKQLILQNRSIRDSKLTAQAWSKGIDMTVGTLISLFQPVNLDLIRSAETPEQALQGYEQLKSDIEERRQVADNNYSIFKDQNLQDIKNSKSASQAKANMIVGFAALAGNMASGAKANADAKKAYHEKKVKFDEFKFELQAMHQKNKQTYLQNAANEPKETLEEYYLEMYDFHKCGYSSIEENFNYESSDWSKASNYCSKPYKNYGSSNIDYKEVVRRKKELASRFSESSELFMNSARYYANKRVIEDKNDPEGYLIRAELSDDIIGRMGDVLIASQLDTERKDLKGLKEETLNQFKFEFFDAIDKGNSSFISKSIENKFHLLALSPKNETPVVYTIRTDNEVMLSLFIDQLAELRDPITLTNILYLCASQNASKCVDALLKRKISDELPGQSTAFQLAIEFGNEKAAIAFLKNDKNPVSTLQNFNEMRSEVNIERTLRYITIAGIESDNAKLVELAKSKKPKLESELYDQQDNYLGYSVRLNAINAFNALVEGNQNAHVIENLNGESLVQLALNSNSFDILKRLKELGADLDQLYKNVDLIFNTKSLKMLEAFQSVGMNINLQDKDGNSIFHIAALNNDLSYFNSNLKADHSLKNNNGYALIHLAALKRNDQLIKLLVKNGADINAPGPYNWRALHFSSRGNDYALTQTLLALGADKKVKDQWNRTPFKVAKERGFLEIKLLLQ